MPASPDFEVNDSGTRKALTETEVELMTLKEAARDLLCYLGPWAEDYDEDEEPAIALNRLRSLTDEA